MKRKKLYRHMHYSAALKKLRLSAVISVIPLIEQLLMHPADISPATVSIGTAFTSVMLLWGILSYRSITYRLTPNGIKLKNGILSRRIFTVPYDRLRVLTFSQGLTERLTGGVSVFLDTAAVLRRYRDIPVCLPLKNAARVKKLFSGRNEPLYRCNIFGALFSAAFLSEPAADAFLLIPVLSQAAAVTGNGAKALTAGYDISLRLLRSFSPGSILIFSGLFFSLWLTAVLIRALRLMKLSSSVSGKYAVTERGILTRVISFSRLDGICALVKEQSGLMYLLKRNNIFLYTAGYEPRGREKNLFAPAQPDRLFLELKNNVFKFDGKEKIIISPPRKAVFSYIALYLGGIMCISAGGIFCIVLGFGSPGTLILCLVPLFLRRMIFVIITFKGYYASVCENHICIRTCKKMKLRSYYLPFGSIQKIIIKQNPLQRKKHTCTMCLYIYSSRELCIPLKHLRESDVRIFIKSINC